MDELLKIFGFDLTSPVYSSNDRNPIPKAFNKIEKEGHSACWSVHSVAPWDESSIRQAKANLDTQISKLNSMKLQMGSSYDDFSKNNQLRTWALETHLAMSKQEVEVKHNTLRSLHATRWRFDTRRGFSIEGPIIPPSLPMRDSIGD